MDADCASLNCAAGTCTVGGRLLLADDLTQGCRVSLDWQLGLDDNREAFSDGPHEFVLKVCDTQDSCWSSDPADNGGDEHFEILGADPDLVYTVRVHATPFNNGWADPPVLVFTIRLEQDSDGDSLWDDWETEGIDTTGDGVPDFVLPDADPGTKDVYLEIDYMQSNGHSHEPNAEVVDSAVAAFAFAPEPIALHVLVDESVAHSNSDTKCPSAQNSLYDQIFGDHFLNHPKRRFAYRYQLWAHASIAGRSGCATPGGRGSVVSLVEEDWTVPWINLQISTLLHELGHSFSLRHGGETEQNYKPNYFSVMNYSHQATGVGLDTGGYAFDYSREKLITLNEVALDENLGVGDPQTNDLLVRVVCQGEEEPWLNLSDSPIDFNCNGATDGNPVAGDITWGYSQPDYGPSDAEMEGFDDWANLRFEFNSSYTAYLYGVGPELVPKEQFIFDAHFSAGLGGPALGSWSTPGGGPHRRGRARIATALRGVVESSAGLPSRAVGAPVVHPSGLLLVATARGLVALRRAPRSSEISLPVWRYPTRGLRAGPAVAFDGSIYIGDTRGRLRALDPQGQETWSFRAAGAIVASPVVGSDGAVYFAARDGYVYAVSSDGQLIWRRNLGAPLTTPPTVGVDNRIHVAVGPRVVALHPVDGSLAWAFRARSRIASACTIGHDGAVIFGTLGGRVHAVDSAGQPLWSRRVGGAVASAPAVAHDGSILVGTRRGWLQALEADGEPRWRLRAGGPLTAQPITDPAGRVFVGTRAGTLLAVDGAGRPEWRLRMRAPMGTAVGADGTLWVVAEGDRIFGVR
ncbi:MAG: PQQ-binding-like beta-propeller repeat protein [bacterium]|nr:PQQ-binding-like beta-propeller repeat protein [bacterium]